MGHSSFYIQAGGKKILTDPVFSSYASPLFFINKAFRGSNVYTAGDILDIDALIISHDHWDHLDYPTILAIKDKVKSVVCPLGVGGYLENWGYDAKIINEGDWFSEVNLGEDFSISILPSQHFSGRFLTPNKTLWASFAIKCGRRQIYFSGDGGYGAHFKKIGREFGGFDAALMENGQYNKSWHRIHLMPNETAQAAEDLNAKAVIPAHSGKFALARHAWDEPYRALCKESEKRSYKLLTPRIGEAVYIGKDQQLTKWWEEMA
jgi:L-ascorbate metabolism protein UlaG (beta-lactamase superfamily)